MENMFLSATYSDQMFCPEDTSCLFFRLSPILQIRMVSTDQNVGICRVALEGQIICLIYHEKYNSVTNISP